MAVRTRIIRIGNSQGIRIPKPLLEQSGLSEEVDLEVQANGILIQAVNEPRTGWDQAFATMAGHQDDQLLDDAPSRSTWDDEEWEW